MSESVKVIELKKRPFKDFQYSQLKLQLKGTDVTEAVVNALRRTALSDIPVYAICNQSILIEQNDTIFNNDYMRLRLSQLPIFNVKNDIIFLPREYWYNIDYSDIKRNKLPEDKKRIDLYLNVNNSTNEIMNVTTDNIKYYEDNEEINNRIKNIKPILLIQLRPNETFKMMAKAVLGIGERDDIWAAASNAFYNKTDKNEFKFIIESQGQMDEYEILVKSCKIIKKKLVDIKKTVNNYLNKIDIKKNKLIEINLKHEDHTLGNIINEGLQNDSNIIFSGLSKPDLLIKNIIIKVVCNGDLITPFNTVIDKYEKIYNTIEKDLLKHGKKYISSNL